MKTVNRRGLLKGAAGVAAAAGAAALTPVIEGTGVFAESGPPPANRQGIAPTWMTPLPLLTYIAVPGLSFRPQLSSTPYASSFAGHVHQTAGALDFFVAAVPVAHGSVLVETEFALLKNDANPATVRLEYNDANGAGMGMLASSTITVASSSIHLVRLDFAPHTVNAGETVILEWDPGSANANHLLFGATVGYLPAGAVTMLRTPVRLVDTRPGATCQYSGGGMFVNGTVRTYGPFTALPASVRGNVQGLIVNLGTTGYTGNGYASLYPPAAAPPGTSTLNYSGGSYAWANGSIVSDGSGGNAGKISVFVSGAPTHVFLDLVGIIA